MPLTVMVRASAVPAFVAVKILRGACADEQTRARFLDEASKARVLDHSNAVRVFDRGESPDGELFIVYELVDGGGVLVYGQVPGPAGIVPAGVAGPEYGLRGVQYSGHDRGP